MGRKPLIQKGDIFRIPLNNNRFAYGQFVFEDKNHGDIIRIFNYFTKSNEQMNLNKIDTSELLFPPIYASIYWAVKNQGWEIIGTLPVTDYTFTGFISDIPYPKKNPDEPVMVRMWYFYDGNKTSELGPTLPKEYQHFESRSIYPADLIVQRIETGFDMFDYPKKHNRFLTKEEIKKIYPNVRLD